MWNCDLNVAQAPQKSFIICQPNFIEKKKLQKNPKQLNTQVVSTLWGKTNFGT